MSSTNVLFERDVNVQTSPKKAESEKPKSMEYHRQVLEGRLKDGNAAPTYISPSDNILSPATQKLAAFKHKHMGKGSDHLFVPRRTQELPGAAVFADIIASGTDLETAAHRPTTKPRSLFAATAVKNHSNAAATSSQRMFADIVNPSDESTSKGATS